MSYVFNPFTGKLDATKSISEISSAYVIETYTGDSATTTFTVTSGNGFESGKVLVFYNGTLLDLTDDYTENATKTAVTTTFTPTTGNSVKLIYFNVGPTTIAATPTTGNPIGTGWLMFVTYS